MKHFKHAWAAFSQRHDADGRAGRRGGFRPEYVGGAGGHAAADTAERGGRRGRQCGEGGEGGWHFAGADAGRGGRARRGGFAGGFGSGMGGEGMMRGRKLSAAELQLVLLALLELQPAHGYELIRQLEAHSGGFYSPSPGMVYPALTYLDDVGEALASADGQRKLYTITEAGAQRLAAERPQADAILAVLARIGSRMGEVREAFGGEDAGAAADEGIRAARHALRQAMMRKRGCSGEEAARIAAILHQAAVDIAGGEVTS